MGSSRISPVVELRGHQTAAARISTSDPNCVTMTKWPRYATGCRRGLEDSHDAITEPACRTRDAAHQIGTARQSHGHLCTPA